eukprot:TRINITY_DN9286_c0_g1_i2.p1 TRINITY_DN9286_c0_g1~~TRINITY_DN9286_c0_g1_i2.p1  ORF type:complete len:476 (+),score=129.38 TRINITY_DN9286_c0_g1_i2:98-1525(+)
MRGAGRPLPWALLGGALVVAAVAAATLLAQAGVLAGRVAQPAERPRAPESAKRRPPAAPAPPRGARPTPPPAQRSPSHAPVRRITDADPPPPAPPLPTASEIFPAAALRTHRHVFAADALRSRAGRPAGPPPRGAPHPFWGGDSRATLRLSRAPCWDGRYKAGRWERDAALAARFPYDGIGEVTGSCGQHRADPTQPRDATLWRWQASECELLDWDEELFCKGLNGRDIMFAGDSIQEAWHTSIYHQLGGRRDLNKAEGNSVGKMRCPTHPICEKYYEKPLKLFHLTNQFLELRAVRQRNYKWYKYAPKYGLLVINSGAWMVDPVEGKTMISDDKYAGYMKQAATFLAKNYNGTIIFRTTYPGHPYCESAAGPLQKPYAPPYPQTYAKFRWEAITRRNEIAVDLFRPIAHILDVRPMTELRPDGHIGRWHVKNFPKHGPPLTGSSIITDCLHYCIPGPMDTWTELLMNMLVGNVV